MWGVGVGTGPWDVFLQAGADALLEQLRARIRASEAELTHERTLGLAAAQAQLQEISAQADFARAWQGEEHAAGVRVWEQVTLQAEKMRQEASPFKLPAQDIRSIASAATGQGACPALIIAPFVDSADGSPGMSVCRQLWWRAQQRADWTECLVGLSGHMRPVRDFDIDLDLIRDVLGAFPFVLIHGDVEVDRVQVRVVGSGVMPEPGLAARSEPLAAGPAVSICGTLPWPDVPGGHRLADDIVDAVLACASALGEVFHLARYRRIPQLHKRVSSWLQPGVTAMIIGGYGIAVENAAWDPDVIRGLQDLVASLPDASDGVRRQAEELLTEVMDGVVTRAFSQGQE
jgi:hypothetical protein